MVEYLQLAHNVRRPSSPLHAAHVTSDATVELGLDALARAGRCSQVADRLEVKEVLVGEHRFVVCRNRWMRLWIRLPDHERGAADGRAPVYMLPDNVVVGPRAGPGLGLATTVRADGRLGRASVSSRSGSEHRIPAQDSQSSPGSPPQGPVAPRAPRSPPRSLPAALALRGPLLLEPQDAMRRQRGVGADERPGRTGGSVLQPISRLRHLSGLGTPSPSAAPQGGSKRGS